MKKFINISSILLTSFLLVNLTKGRNISKPNFIIILADDLGFGDLSSYGNPVQEAGPIDKLAQEGMLFRQWYSAETVCTPSRAAILTGRLPIRSGMVGNQRVLLPNSCGGLPRAEITIAEALKEAGYTTGMTGKWHLGINKDTHDDGYHLPVHHGFDFVGYTSPFTNSWQCDELKIHMEEPDSRYCFLYKNKTIVQQPVKIKKLTLKSLIDTATFIGRNRRKPFFFYYAMHHIHVALNPAKPFVNSSLRGRLGDSINEMNWAVGEIIKMLKKYSLQRNTLVFFLSDHGPSTELCSEGGITNGLKGGKSNNYEGGIRVPAIAWWPGTIKPGIISTELASSMDLFPTILDFAGHNLPYNQTRIIDGKSLKSLLLGKSKSPHSVLFHYCCKILTAVRYHKYKLVYYTQKTVPENYYTENCTNGIPRRETFELFSCKLQDLEVHKPPLIYNINEDHYERYPLPASEYKDLVAAVDEIIRQHRDCLIPVPDQLECRNSYLAPCCNPPSCTRNYYNLTKV